MSTGKPAKSPPTISPTSARKIAPDRHQARRSRANRTGTACQTRECVVSVLELDCDPATIAEFFSDDLHYRVETRGYFWGFFD